MPPNKRRAYNGAFEAFGLTVKGVPCDWPTKYYDLLQNTVAGGKGKMKYHFNNNGWEIATRDGPVAVSDRDALVDALQVRGALEKERCWPSRMERAPSAWTLCIWGLCFFVGEGVTGSGCAVVTCGHAFFLDTLPTRHTNTQQTYTHNTTPHHTTT